MISTMTDTSATDTSTTGIRTTGIRTTGIRSVVALGVARLRTGLLSPVAVAQGTGLPVAGRPGVVAVGGADQAGTIPALAAAGQRAATNAESHFRTPHTSVRWSDDL